MILDKKELKKKLDQLYDTRKEHSEIVAKVNKLKPAAYVKDYAYKSAKYFPYTKHKISIIAENPRLVKQLEEYQDILNNSACDLLAIEQECELFISQLPTSRLRRIFRCRYLEQYSWIKTAYVIGGNATADSLRKEHDRFFLEN